MSWISIFDAARWPLIALYAFNVALVAAYGMHMLWLTGVFLRRRHQAPRAPGQAVGPDGREPYVTVQLPLFNEEAVAERVMRAAGELDWPRDRLEIQVLDDSTEAGSRAVVDRVAEDMRRAGHDITVLRRENRVGYKAGALGEGLLVAKGSFTAVFDADFVPRPDLLRRLMDYFSDERVGMVQARWAHLNANESLLTRAQEMFIDGHFVIEQSARSRSGWMFNFNGTGGIWRNACIPDAGGWTQRTLSEDLDLSFRAQMRGWKCIYDLDTEVPAELPSTMGAFKIQQRRWNKGTVECAKLLLGPVWKSDLSPWTKVEATIQLVRPAIQFWIIAMVLLAFPVSVAGVVQPLGQDWTAASVMALALWVIASAASSLFYIVSAWALGKSVWRAALTMPVVIAVGVGISLSNAWAVGEALLGKASAFVRTPKFGQEGKPAAPPVAHRAPRRRPVADRIATYEGLIALYLAVCIGASVLLQGSREAAPFLLLCGLGYAWSATGSFLRAQPAA